MNPTKEEMALLEAGKSAQEVLNHPAFQSTYLDCKNACIKGILESPEDASKQREDLYMLSRAVDTFVNALASRVKTAQDVQAKLDIRDEPDEHEPLPEITEE